ncbi:MAG: hypothetical protein JRG89_14145, partial [Deltaproteobacteria bacterium]|nr:hypothetical protein [Deltaproteobacteria bacterium]
TGNAGSDGDLGFGENVNLSANQIFLRAGLNGATAGDGETPSVDLRTNDPSFSFVDLSEDGDPPDTVFEIRQDAGFVDDASNIEDDESLIFLANQVAGGDELGTVRLVSDAGNITITNLTTSFIPFLDGSSGSIARLDLQAGGADPLDRGTIIIMDGAAVDTDLTLYDGIEITSDEIILAANGMGTVIAHDPDVLFRDISTNSDSDPLRFTIRHDQSDICESVAGCGTGALPSLDQFVTPVSSQSVDYTLQSMSGFVELTSQITGKLTAGTNSSPRRVDLTLLGNDQDGDVDVLISANVLGRDADVHLNSLVVGEVNDPLRIEFAASANESVHLATAENQTYYGEVKIDGAVVLTGDTLHFTDDITADSLSGNDADLTLNVREHLRLDRDIDLDRATGELRINLDPNADSLARIEFGRDGFDQTVTANRVEIFATREKDLGEGDGFFPGNSRSSKVATIGKRSGDLDFAVDSFFMSEGEKLSVGGALTIGDAATLEAWIGDLSALTIDVIADAITIVLRESGRYLGLDGSVEGDAGVDLVANTIHLDGEIDTVGDGRAPSFGLLDPFAADDNLARFPVAGLNPGNLPIRASDFDWDLAHAPPDLHPNGAARDDFSNIYFGKEVVPVPNAWRADRPLPTNDEHLARIDIELRDDSLQTLRSRLEGAGITDDVSSDLPSRESSRVTISTSRILAKDAESVAARYIRLFGEDDSRTDEVKRALTVALDDYRLTSGTRRVLGFEFRRFLRNRPSSQFDAYLALEDLDVLFSYHRNLGLTPGEYNRIQLRWLASIKPDGISLEELAEAVHPSRFIRGSDILDIFGE